MRRHPKLVCVVRHDTGDIMRRHPKLVCVVRHDTAKKLCTCLVSNSDAEISLLVRAGLGGEDFDKNLSGGGGGAGTPLCVRRRGRDANSWLHASCVCICGRNVGVKAKMQCTGEWKSKSEREKIGEKEMRRSHGRFRMMGIVQ